MLTHKQIARLNRTKLKEHTSPNFFLLEPVELWPPPVVVKARTVKDNLRVGIHLLNPTKKELDEAFETAIRDGFGVIIIHTKRTFRK